MYYLADLFAQYNKIYVECDTKQEVQDLYDSISLPEPVINKTREEESATIAIRPYYMDAIFQTNTPLLIEGNAHVVKIKDLPKINTDTYILPDLNDSTLMILKTKAQAAAIFYLLGSLGIVNHNVKNKRVSQFNIQTYNPELQGDLYVFYKLDRYSLQWMNFRNQEQTWGVWANKINYKIINLIRSGNINHRFDIMKAVDKNTVIDLSKCSLVTQDFLRSIINNNRAINRCEPYAFNFFENQCINITLTSSKTMSVNTGDAARYKARGFKILTEEDLYYTSKPIQLKDVTLTTGRKIYLTDHNDVTECICIDPETLITYDDNENILDKAKYADTFVIYPEGA